MSWERGKGGHGGEQVRARGLKPTGIIPIVAYSVTVVCTLQNFGQRIIHLLNGATESQLGSSTMLRQLVSTLDFLQFVAWVFLRFLSCLAVGVGPIFFPKKLRNEVRALRRAVAATGLLFGCCGLLLNVYTTFEAGVRLLAFSFWR